MWLEKASNISKSSKPYSYDELGSKSFDQWLEAYRQDIQKLLNVPQLGLTRAYQERAAEFIDKLNIFQGKSSEFFIMLFLPIEKSLKVMQEQMEQELENDELSADFKHYYQIWLKTLEGHYMTLFTSPEYVKCMHETLGSLEDLSNARQGYLQDALKSLPVPTNQDMDELYKEVYQLKKQLRQLKKELKAQKKSAGKSE